ncbi:hypothetical protein ACROYT_G017534 [Oculina patagonica]
MKGFLSLLVLIVLSSALHTKADKCCKQITAQLKEMKTQLDKLQKTTEETNGSKTSDEVLALRKAARGKGKKCCQQLKELLKEMKIQVDEIQEKVEEIKNKTFAEVTPTPVAPGYALLFPGKSTSDYVIINNAMPSLTAVTICVWMKTTDTENFGTPLSYAVPGTDNELMLYDYNRGLMIEVANSYSQTPVTANDGKWHHICATWENTAGSWKMYKDGKLGGSGTGRQTGHVIPAGGALVLGQEQDSVGGSFDDKQNFIGEMTGVNIWDHVITDQEILRMSQSCQSGEGNVFKWSDFKDHVKGSVKIIEPSC